MKIDDRAMECENVQQIKEFFEGTIDLYFPEFSDFEEKTKSIIREGLDSIERNVIFLIDMFE